MESRFTIHIAPAEWRWVIVVATGLVLLTFAPLVWVAVAGTNDWQFMGALHNYQDAATYISKMELGARGGWLTEFQHTPEPHPGALIAEIYPLLGQLSRVVRLPTIVMYHVARVGAALLMYLAIYQLAASIWQRVRTRRIFFVVAAVGAGFGWLLFPLSEMAGILRGNLWPDLQIPEAFPLVSTYVNVHFPLAVGILALLVSLFVNVLRPGAYERRDTGMSAPAMVLLSVLLALLYPHALVPLASGVALYIGIAFFERRTRLARWVLRWWLTLVLPAIPIAIYFYVVVTTIPAFAEWNRQNVTLAPSPLTLVLGFGLPLLIGLPALLRAIRQFELDDDRLMLLWLLAMVVWLYLPSSTQRRFMVGMMLPVAYFTTRAIEDFWFQRISRRHRNYALALVVSLMAVSPLFMLFQPVLPVIAGDPARAVGIFLERDYASAFQWLDGPTGQDDVVLVSPIVGAWLPGWSGARVIYGHPLETLNAAAKRAQVESWYQSEASAACAELLNKYDVRFVIVGPEERKLGAVGCAETLTRVIDIGQVSLYAP